VSSSGDVDQDRFRRDASGTSSFLRSDAARSVRSDAKASARRAGDERHLGANWTFTEPCIRYADRGAQGLLVSSAEGRPPGPAAWEFVRRIAIGDADAENEFVRRFDRGIRALVRRHCRQGDSAIEDLVQDVFVRVLERLRAGALREPEALPAYIQTTIVHVTAAFYRKPATDSAPVPDGLENNPASDPDPAATAATQQLSRQLRSLLDELPVERDRKLLVLFYLEEQDKDEVCRTLGIDAGHFHRVVFRARERFRALVDRAGLGGGAA